MPLPQRLTSQKLDNAEHDAGVKSVGVKVWDTDNLEWIKWDGEVNIDMDTAGISTSANQTNGSQKTKIVTSTGTVVDTFGTPDGATETTLAKLTDVLYATEYGATYNYIMKYKRGTTTWEIQRETISTGVREYANGTTALATGWSGRAGATYGGAV